MTGTSPLITFILGGARSGKSSRAQALAEAAGFKRCYVATAQAFDDEMKHRIAAHQAERDNGWATLEAPLDLSDAVTSVDKSCDVVLIDCLTGNARMPSEGEALIKWMRSNDSWRSAAL